MGPDISSQLLKCRHSWLLPVVCDFYNLSDICRQDLGRWRQDPRSLAWEQALDNPWKKRWFGQLGDVEWTSIYRQTIRTRNPDEKDSTSALCIPFFMAKKYLFFFTNDRSIHKKPKQSFKAGLQAGYLPKLPTPSKRTRFIFLGRKGCKFDGAMMDQGFSKARIGGHVWEKCLAKTSRGFGRNISRVQNPSPFSIKR